MSIGRTIPEIKIFQTLTLKFQLQGQGHGCGQRARSYKRPSIILTHFFFISHQSDQQFMKAISKTDLETSKVKVMSEVEEGQGHILYPASNWCTSFLFHINRTNHSWDMAKSVFDLEKTSEFSKEDLPKIKVSNRTSTKSNQVITTTRTIILPAVFCSDMMSD